MLAVLGRSAGADSSNLVPVGSTNSVRAPLMLRFADTRTVFGAVDAGSVGSGLSDWSIGTPMVPAPMSTIGATMAPMTTRPRRWRRTRGATGGGTGDGRVDGVDGGGSVGGPLELSVA